MLDIVLPRRTTRTCDGATRRDFLRVGSLGLAGLSLRTSASRGQAANERNGERPEVGHPRLPRRRPVAPRQLRPQARRPGRDPRQVQADRHQRPRPARRRDAAADGAGDGQGRARPLRGAQQRPPRDGDQLGAVRPLRLAVRRLPGDRRRRRARDRLHAARCRPTSRCRATRRSPGSWARARSSAAATSRSRPATPTQPNYKVQDLAPAEALTPKQAERRETLLAGRRRAGASRSRATTRSPPTTSSTQRAPRDGAVDRGPQRVRHRPGDRTSSATATAATPFGQSLLLARRLVERGVRFVTVNYGGWDHHAKIFESLDKKLPEFDQAAVGAGRGHARPRACSTTRWWW